MSRNLETTLDSAELCVPICGDMHVLQPDGVAPTVQGKTSGLASLLPQVAIFFLNGVNPMAKVAIFGSTPFMWDFTNIYP